MAATAATAAKLSVRMLAIFGSYSEIVMGSASHLGRASHGEGRRPESSALRVRYSASAARMSCGRLRIEKWPSPEWIWSRAPGIAWA
jgi:hypothetical protein